MSSIHERIDKVQELPWDELRLVLAISTTGTLSGAGRQLGISQPTMGRRLEVIETLFGQKLFQRTTRGLVATDAGVTVTKHARLIEEEVAALSRKLFGTEQTFSGTIRISSSEWFTNHILMPVFDSFMHDHPCVVIEAIVDTRSFDLDRREADLVFRFGGFTQSDIVQRKLATIEYGLFASASYINLHGIPKYSEANDAHRVILMDEAFSHLADVVWMKETLPEAKVAFRSNSRDTQSIACSSGVGLAILPCIMARGRDLIPIDLGHNPPGRDIFIGYHADLKPLTRLRTFIEHIIENVPPLL